LFCCYGTAVPFCDDCGHIRLPDNPSSKHSSRRSILQHRHFARSTNVSFTQSSAILQIHFTPGNCLGRPGDLFDVVLELIGRCPEWPGESPLRSTQGPHHQLHRRPTTRQVVRESEPHGASPISAPYAVNHNVAPVMSASFGLCEASLGSAGNSFLNSLWG
jgi:hypothetical protein